MRIGSSLPPLPDSRRDYRGAGHSSSDGDRAVAARPGMRLGGSGTRELAALEQSANVAPRNRQALQSYFANLPSMGERLGVELAGVDVYV